MMKYTEIVDAYISSLPKQTEAARINRILNGYTFHFHDGFTDLEDYRGHVLGGSTLLVLNI